MPRSKGGKDQKAAASEADLPQDPRQDPNAVAIVRGHCSGLVKVQYKGKGKFEQIWLALAPRSPSLSFRDGSRDGKEVRSADADGCTVGLPKTQRKGHSIAFRLDLKDKDSKGCAKYIVAVETQEELDHWLDSLQSYSTEPQPASLDHEGKFRESVAPAPSGDEELAAKGAARGANEADNATTQKAKKEEEKAKKEEEKAVAKTGGERKGGKGDTAATAVDSATGEAAESDENPVQLTLICPADKGPGDTFALETEHGKKVITVPDGVEAGDDFAVTLDMRDIPEPAAPDSVQLLQLLLESVEEETPEQAGRGSTGGLVEDQSRASTASGASEQQEEAETTPRSKKKGAKKESAKQKKKRKQEEKERAEMAAAEAAAIVQAAEEQAACSQDEAEDASPTPEPEPEPQLVEGAEAASNVQASQEEAARSEEAADGTRVVLAPEPELEEGGAKARGHTGADDVLHEDPAPATYEGGSTQPESQPQPPAHPQMQPEPEPQAEQLEQAEAVDPQCAAPASEPEPELTTQPEHGEVAAAVQRSRTRLRTRPKTDELYEAGKAAVARKNQAHKDAQKPVQKPPLLTRTCPKSEDLYNRCASPALAPLSLIFSYKSEKSLCTTGVKPPWRGGTKHRKMPLKRRNRSSGKRKSRVVFLGAKGSRIQPRLSTGFTNRCGGWNSGRMSTRTLRRWPELRAQGVAVRRRQSSASIPCCTRNCT